MLALPRSAGPSLRGWSRFLCPACSILGLAGLVVVSGSASAVNTGSLNLSASVAEAGLDLSLSSTNVLLNLAPPYSGDAFQSSAVTVSVASHSSGGYQVLMYGNQALTNVSDSTLTINPISSSTCSTGCIGGTGSTASTGSNFTTNSWGYAITHTTSETPNYLPIKEGYNIIDNNTGTSGDTIVNFGAKVNYEQTPGTYNNTLNFVAVANVSTLLMQDVTASDCTTAAETLVTDSRDGNHYSIKRLADGKCWMLDNLALDPTDPVTQENMTESSTNASAESLAAFKLGAEAAGIDNASGKYATAEINSDAWTSSSDNWTIPRINADSKDILSNGHIDAGVLLDSSSGRVGVYYNYCAASAGSYCYGDGSGSGNTLEDICPIKWKLPEGGSGSYFNILYTSAGVGNYSNFINALQLALSGNYINGATDALNINGHWWSSTFASENYMRDLYVSKYETNSFSADPRTSGFTIRCVLK